MFFHAFHHIFSIFSLVVVVGGGVGDAVEVVDEEVASAVVSDGSPVPDPDPDNQRIDARKFFFPIH